MGGIEVPIEALYGAQTQRAIENFPAGDQPAIGDFPELVQALLIVKQAAAKANCAIGAISEEQEQTILSVCQSITGESKYDQFPFHYLHCGGGTSANMNANEVIANMGEEKLGGTRGEYKHLHPNDHVNLNQSTNDVYPTACHLAVLLKWKKLQPGFKDLRHSLDRKIAEFGNQKRIARTCLQDAVDISFGDFFGGYSSLIKRCETRLEKAVSELSRVNLGGTIVDRSEDVPKEYFELVITELNQLFPDYEIKRSDNLFDGTQNLDDLVMVSSQLDLASRSFIKIAKDIRLLASGPETGLKELSIPSVQPGSSIMPGKVNPVIPEFLIQVCFRVIGNHQMCSMAVDHGELDLNVWESTVVFGILESMGLLEKALFSFTHKCIAGLSVPSAVNSAKADSIIPLLTELVKKHGYSKINELCKDADGSFDRIRERIKELGLKA